MKQVIYYFSGTGNSLRAARKIAEEIGGADLISMRNPPQEVSAENADIIGFVCPLYEWDIPKTVRNFLASLTVNPQAYIFMVSTYIAIHGRCFETVDSILQEKHTQLHYGKALRCVASQCIAYEPFPSPKWMVPLSDKKAKAIGREIAAGKRRSYPKMGLLARKLYSKMMQPFMNVQHEYDRGFYVSGDCVGCELCRKICPCGNITFSEKKPVWNHHCEGCNACVVYCPKKAIQFQTPEAYLQLDNTVSRRLELPDTRTRYHNPYITAADLIQLRERISAAGKNE